MNFWATQRGPGSVRLLAEAGQQHGLAQDALLAGTDLDPTAFGDWHTRVSARQELRLADNLLRLLGWPRRLGWTLGQRYHHSMHGLWGYGLVSSATAGDALAHALDFLPLSFAFTDVHLQREGDRALLCFGEPALPDALRCFVVERDMAAALRLLHDVIGPGFRLRGLLRRGEPGAALPDPAAAPGATLGAAVNALVFDAAVLAQPLPLADAATYRLCRQHCERQRAQWQPDGTLAGWLADYLRFTPEGRPPSLSTVARLTGHSERTLKRRLHDEGSSYRALLTRVRQERADTLLADRRLPLSTIAERLGYSDASSFSQTFKRWHGTAPRLRRPQAPPPEG